MKKIKLYKYYFSYLKNIIYGNFHPFLVNETDFFNIKSLYSKNIEHKDSLKSFYIFLKKKYGSKKKILITKSGRHALEILLNSINLPKKSEILIPSYSCLGLVQPIISTGFTPHFVDINNDLNPSFESIRNAINKNIKACIFPYLAGNFSDDFFKIKDLCKKKKNLLIEDCCQAYGLKYKKKDVGLFSDASFFSSGVGKPIFTPEGGWLIVNNTKIIKSEFPNLSKENSQYFFKNDYLKFCDKYSDKYLRVIMNMLSETFNLLIKTVKKEVYSKEKITSNSTISNLSAAIILNEIKKNEMNIKIRKKNAKYWFSKLSGSNVDFFCNENSIYNKLFVKTDNELKRKIILDGFQVESGYKPLHLRYNFNKFPKQNLNNTTNLWNGIFSLPIRPSLKNII